MEITNNYNYYIANNKKIQKQSFRGEKPGNVSAPITNNMNSNQIMTLEQSNAIKAQRGLVNSAIGYKKIGILKTELPYNVHYYKLANGQKVIIVPKKGPTIVKTYINTGSMNEPDEKRGISHFIEHNLFNGTKKLAPGEFFRNVSKMGGSTNASTGLSQTDYYIKSQLLTSDDFEQMLELHSDMLQNPQFPVDQIEKELGPVTSEISMIEDDPGNIAINECIRNLYQIKSTSQDLIAGNISNIKNITQDDLNEYYAQNYSPDNMVTVITGEVNPNDTIKLVSEKFIKNKPQKAQKRKYEDLRPIQNTIITHKTHPNTKTAIGSIGFVGPKNDNAKEKIISEVLLDILNSPDFNLFYDFEKMNVNGQISIEKVGNRYNDNRAIIFCLECSDDNINRAIEVLYQDLNAIKNGAITDNMLNAAKEKLLSEFVDISESSELINCVVGSSILDGDINYITSYSKILKSITIDDLIEYSNKFFNTDKASISIIHPIKNTANRIENKKGINISFGGQNITKDVYDETKIETYTLDNNMRLVINPTEIQKTTFKINLESKEYSDANPTALRVLTKLLNHGSIEKNREDYDKILSQNNIDLYFSSDQNSIEIAGRCKPQNLCLALELAKDTIFAPRFTENEFENAKIAVKEELLADKSSRMLNERLFPNLPQMSSRKELLKQIDQLTLDDVLELYMFILDNAQAKSTFTMPVENKENIENLKKILQEDTKNFKEFSCELTKTYTENEKSDILYHCIDRKQAGISKAYTFEISNSLEQKVKFALLNTILGGCTTSRLFLDLREKQKLAYRVNSNFSTIGNTGMITLNIYTTTDDPNDSDNNYQNIVKSLQGFDKHTNNLKKEMVSQQELNEAKKILKTDILNALESTIGQTDNLSDSQNSPFGVYSTDMILEIIDNITKEDILDAALYVFNKKPITAISASNNTLSDLFNSEEGETLAIK